MSTIKGAIASPFVLFGLALVAFVAWLAYDATNAPAATRGRDQLPTATATPFPDPVEDRLGGLAPGQPRLLVEEQLAGLTLPQVDPIDVSSGKPVCRERYSVHLVRPVPRLMPAKAEGFSPGPYTLTVEFDGAAPGHPLARFDLTPGALHPIPLRPLPPAP